MELIRDTWSDETYDLYMRDFERFDIYDIPKVPFASLSDKEKERIEWMHDNILTEWYDLRQAEDFQDSINDLKNLAIALDEYIFPEYKEKKDNAPAAFQVCIGNRAESDNILLVGEWLSLPATKEDAAKVFGRLGIENDDYFIIAFQPGLVDEAILDDFDEDASLNELNYLANIVSAANANDRKKSLAILEWCYAKNDENYLNALLQPDRFKWNPDVKNAFDLGKWRIKESGRLPESLEGCFDFEKYGEKTGEEEHGVYTKYGYISPTEYPESDCWKGEVPEEYKIC